MSYIFLDINMKMLSVAHKCFYGKFMSPARMNHSRSSYTEFPIFVSYFNQIWIKPSSIQYVPGLFIRGKVARA